MSYGNCLKCGALLDEYGGINAEGHPESGDLAMCGKCGNLMKLSEELTAVNLSDYERLEIYLDPIMRELLSRAGFVRHILEQNPSN